MAFGILVKNTQGATQIDQTYSAFRVVSRGQASPGAEHPVPDSASQILLVRPSSSLGVVSSRPIGTQLYAYSVSGVEWVLLQLANTVSPSAESFGLRVRGQNGIVFDSGVPVMCPQANGVFDGNLSSPRARVNLATPPIHARKRYVEWSFLRRGYGLVYNQGSGLPFGNTVIATAEFDDQGVSVGLVIGPNGPAINAPPDRAIIKFLVADV